MNGMKALAVRRHSSLTLALEIASLVVPTICSAEEITIRIAPATLNLESDGSVVTVHTDVPYSAVAVYTVYLSGVPIQSWKADDRGFFVAKFLMDNVKTIDGLVINDYNTFRFVALTKNDNPVWGEADVKVIDRGH